MQDYHVLSEINLSPVEADIRNFLSYNWTAHYSIDMYAIFGTHMSKTTGRIMHSCTCNTSAIVSDWDRDLC